MKTKKIDWRVLIAAIVALTIIECVALMNGINGTLLLMVFAIIAGIGGVAIPVKTK